MYDEAIVSCVINHYFHVIASFPHDNTLKFDFDFEGYNVILYLKMVLLDFKSNVICIT